MEQLLFIMSFGKRCQFQPAAIRGQAPEEPIAFNSEERIGNAHGLLKRLLIENLPAFGFLPMPRGNAEFLRLTRNPASTPLRQRRKAAPPQTAQASLAVN